MQQAHKNDNNQNTTTKYACTLGYNTFKIIVLVVQVPTKASGEMIGRINFLERFELKKKTEAD